jgi:hypothetical protein
MATTLNVLGKFPKKPAAVKRYQADFSEWLDTGETVQSCTFDVSVSAGTDAGVSLTVEDDSILTGNTAVAFFVSGGVVGVTYEVKITVVTSAGQTEVWSVFFQVRN